MTSLGRRLFSETAIYGLGGMASQALGILLVPFYARELGVANYGVTAIINTTLSLGLAVASLALPTAFFRYYLREATTPAERAEVVATSIGLRLLASVAALAIFSALAVPLAFLAFGSAESAGLLIGVAAIIFFDSVNMLPLSVLRAEHRAGAYVLLAFSRAVLGTVLILALVVGFKFGVPGVIIGSLGSAVVTTALAWGRLALEGRLRIGLDRRIARGMLAFSLPLVPAALAGWGLNISDRYVVAAIAGNHAVGLYSAGYTVGIVINALAIQPFTLAWAAAYWEIARRDDAPHAFARVLTGFSVVAGGIALALSAFGTDGLRILLGAAFVPGRYVVPFSAFAYVLYGIFSIVASGLQIAAQTRWVPVALGVAAAANLALNLVAVPSLGFMGAAYVNLATYALLAAVTGVIAYRYYPVPWDILCVAATLLIGIGLALAAILGPDTVIWRAACFVVYLPILALVGVFRLGQIRQLLALLRPSPTGSAPLDGDAETVPPTRDAGSAGVIGPGEDL